MLVAIAVVLFVTSAAQPATGRRDKTVSIGLTDGNEQYGVGQRYASIRYCPPLERQCTSGREGWYRMEGIAKPGSRLAACRRYMRGAQAAGLAAAGGSASLRLELPARAQGLRPSDAFQEGGVRRRAVGTLPGADASVRSPGGASSRLTFAAR